MQKSITTKTGDDGYTRLFTGQKVAKDTLRLELCGDIDELVSILGVARNHAKKSQTKNKILYVQQCLFVFAGELMTKSKKKDSVREKLDTAMIKVIEGRCKKLESRIKLPKGFVIPADGSCAACIDFARAVARRCERKAVTLLRKKEITNKLLIIWLNRLSDYLYLLARSLEKTRTLR